MIECKSPRPPGEIEITLGTPGSLVILESRAPEGRGPCGHLGDTYTHTHTPALTHRHAPRTLRTQAQRHHQDRTHKANCSNGTKGRRHLFSCVVPTAPFTLCTKPKACGCSPRGAWVGVWYPRPCQRQGAHFRWRVNKSSRAQQVCEGLWKACGLGTMREFGCFSGGYRKPPDGGQDGLGSGINLCRKGKGLPPSSHLPLLAVLPPSP